MVKGNACRPNGNPQNHIGEPHRPITSFLNPQPVRLQLKPLLQCAEIQTRIFDELARYKVPQRDGGFTLLGRL